MSFTVRNSGIGSKPGLTPPSDAKVGTGTTATSTKTATSTGTRDAFESTKSSPVDLTGAAKTAFTSDQATDENLFPEWGDDGTGIGNNAQAGIDPGEM